jgi:Animal haem peroxidase
MTELDPTTGVPEGPGEAACEPAIRPGSSRAVEPAHHSRGRAPFREILLALSEYVDRRIGWDKLPTPLGLADLAGLRALMRERNLYDTSHLPATNLPPIEPPSPRHQVNRTADGSYNDLEEPRMGMTGARFGRNIPLDRIPPASPSDVLSPNPREISRRLLTRTEFVPAGSVNSLVAAWVQFMIRDWFSHGRRSVDNPWTVPLADDDPWPERPMVIPRTQDDPTRPSDAGEFPLTHINVTSHWWDASQIYGGTADEQQRRRTGVDGKLHITEGGLLPISDDPERDVSREPGFWLGLAMMGTLFTRERNAICDMLRRRYPNWSDNELFQRARLINAALIAKIHTVEWTPAIISHPTTVAALRANWWGLAGERVHRLLGRVSSSEIISGIVGGETNHFGVPYSLTEEFVAVYRMHPLIRDDWPLRSAADDATVRSCSFRDIAGPQAIAVMNDIPMSDLLYSFGTLPPGLVTLHNFPRYLQEFERPDGHLQDLAATDVLRDRENGVPRYNEFRRLLRLTPASTFEDLTDNGSGPRTSERPTTATSNRST